MSWGKRALPLAATALALPALVSGCRLVDSHWQLIEAEPGYVPLTEATFADAITEAMFRHPTMHLEMEAGVGTMSMDVRYGATDDDLAMTGTYDDGVTVGEMTIVDGEAYFRDEGERIYFQLPDYLVDQVLAEMSMGSPAEMASTFESGIETLEYGASHEVEYGMTHRYDVRMRKEFLADELDVPIERVPDVTYRLWLDDHNLLRRMIVVAMGETVDATFSEWGEPVTIEAPPPGQVEPLPVPTDDV
ncbi:hypothetical protein D0Z08_10905 [Nocardioides immobilis]|uniref:LppX_LprAFG lipoprotein n=1 Tax=Nocardioides immobilis TaxID=2049295 RepID=A0A417Y3I2_9ACTN|nr:hypothetical protein [Nocardioides immobilis]RHW27165.1 hypothetical protein D0Z08_10905 [Nocardioides immobilis]